MSCGSARGCCRRDSRGPGTVTVNPIAAGTITPIGLGPGPQVCQLLPYLGDLRPELLVCMLPELEQPFIGLHSLRRVPLNSIQTAELAIACGELVRVNHDPLDP